MSNKKQRMSMLDNLAAASGAHAPPAPSGNRALASARSAVDAHHVWDLDPSAIDDNRPADRLEPEDVADLIEAIETNGQTVPILVRRHPTQDDRYLLVYGRRRLEAIRLSDKVTKVRALIASLDDSAAVRAQISENMARRDLSYIEKALFSQELISSGFGNQSQVAEVLTVTKSSISMAMAVVQMVTPDLIRAIGPAPGIGRPRWEALGKAIEEIAPPPDTLMRIAEDIHTEATAAVIEGQGGDAGETSVAAFEAVERHVLRALKKREAPTPPRTARRMLSIDGTRSGSVARTSKGVAITLDRGPFADWINSNAEDLITDLHARWKKRTED